MSLTVVVGGGVVGLACARAIAQRSPKGSSVLLLEALSRLGSETSGRNSGVIHSGIYYPTGSAKASMCVAGRHQLYQYLTERAVSHNRCGKLIVSTAEQDQNKLHAILQQARNNGLGEEEARLIDAHEARALEPELHCRSALLCSATGVVDAAHLMQLLAADLDALGVDVVINCEATGITYNTASHSFCVDTTQGELQAQQVVNCAGHMAVKLANRMQLSAYPGGACRVHELSPRHAFFAKGSYFKMQPNQQVFRHLVYPLPTEGGLGVHSTVDLAQQMRFGPDVEWLPSPSDPSTYAWDMHDCTAKNLAMHYQVDPTRSKGFYEDIRRYYPNLPDNSLVPDFAGIRPKLKGPTGPTGGHAGHDAAAAAAPDFLLHGPARHGVRGLVNLFGIESPGLTSSLALADRVAEELGLGN